MKKILASILAIAIISATYVTSFAALSAATNPYVSVKSVNEITSTVYYNVTLEEPADGEKYYEIIVDLKNLPDLTMPNRTTGVRLGGYSADLFVDNFSNLKKATLIEAGWGGETESILKPAASVNALNNSISIVAAKPTALTAAFPTSATDAALDVDGVLSNAFVVYIATTGSMNITSTYLDIQICTNGVASANTVSYQNTDSDLNIAIGSTETGDFTPIASESQTVKENEVAKTYDGKYLKHIATVLENTALSKKVSITNTKTGEKRVSDRTLAETLRGIGVESATVTGNIAIGVLTDDVDAAFTFSLE